jgi:signal transduction histidine kinase
MLCLLIGPCLLAILKLVPAFDQIVAHRALAHVLIVGSTTFLGSVLALVILRVGRAARDGRVFLIGMGFLTTASILFIHAIATPNVLMSGRDLAAAWSAPLSLVLGGGFFALSGVPLAPRLNQRLMRWAGSVLGVYLVFWLSYSALVLLVLPATEFGALRTTVATSDPAMPASSFTPQDHVLPAGAYAARDEVGMSPTDHAAMGQLAGYGGPLDTALLVLTIVGLASYTFAGLRQYQLYRQSPSAAGWAITCGMVFLGEAFLTQRLSTTYSLAFWLYHAEEFAGFAIISAAVLGAFAHGQSGWGWFESLFLAPTLARIQIAQAQAMDALIAMLSAGAATEDQLHTLRQQFGLTASQARVFEQTALAVAQERQQRQELEQLNAMLRQLEQDKEQLTQMVVHDLKNPLTGLVGFLEILRLQPLSADQRMLLDGALRSGKNLSGLISDLLDVGRSAEGRLELDCTCFRPGDLLADCAAELGVWLADEGKTVQIAAAEPLPLLHADQRLLRRVVLNLLSNAIKHTGPGTHIILRATMIAASGTEDTDGVQVPTLVLAVEDSGDGIRPEDLSHIFEKFGRGKGGHTSRQTSTGLGLTFCRLAVETHGGTIDVASVVGQGTTFRIMLPMTDSDPMQS